ncbi:DMT family transporter [Virgibacillus necropolis]|uniref:DMT family transporter n=1 Tax=Virgibacillus necropolis TaxID=163877 RepID=UPI001D03AA5D|nr:DMT family transporter [Virgibacillus necropolis]
MNKDKTFLSLLTKHKWAVWLTILLITIIWGYAWVLMKLSLNYMGPFTFSAFRFAVGSLTLLLIVWISKMGVPPRAMWKHLIILGVLQTSVVFLLVMYGLRFVDAGKSSVLLYSMPLWSSLFAAKYLGEKITPAKLTGLLIGMLGLLTILGWDIWIGQNVNVIIGESLIILAAISWGIANVYYRLKLQDMPKLQSSAYQMLFGTIGIIVATLFIEWGQPLSLHVNSIYYILFTGVFASALCFTVWFYILSIIDMVTATLATLLVPIFGLLFSRLILGETFTLGITMGSTLIIIGIIVAQVKKRNSPRR